MIRIQCAISPDYTPQSELIFWQFTSSSNIPSAFLGIIHLPHIMDQAAARHMDKQKAATAIARKLLVVVWNVLTRRETDRQGEAEKVGRSLLVWD